jgi:membrane protease YdiL (CAAX protease family)
MSYSDFFFYWIIPALPGLSLLLFTILIEIYLRSKKSTPWMVGHFARIISIIIFMIFALLTSADLNQQLINYLNDQWSFGVKDLLAIVIVMAVMYFFQSKQRDKVKEIQVFRSAQMNLKQLTVYSFVWILYLTCYEIYFRGYLLFIAFPDTSIYIIITFNLFLYAFVHLNKGWQQVIMSFPFGFLLCLVTLFTGHIWFALIIHIQLALGFELPLLGKSQTNLSTQ